MRLFPVKFSNLYVSDYIKSVSIGRVNNQIVLFDSHGDIIDISNPFKGWKIKRIISKLTKSL